MAKQAAANGGLYTSISGFVDGRQTGPGRSWYGITGKPGSYAVVCVAHGATVQVASLAAGYRALRYPGTVACATCGALPLPPVAAKQAAAPVQVAPTLAAPVLAVQVAAPKVPAKGKGK